MAGIGVAVLRLPLRPLLQGDGLNITTITAVPGNLYDDIAPLI